MATPILLRVAAAMYRANPDDNRGDYGSLPAVDRRRYEVMAAAGLSVALLEPVYPTGMQRH